MSDDQRPQTFEESKMDRNLCHLSIVSLWPTKDGYIVQEYPDRIIDRIMQIVDTYTKSLTTERDQARREVEELRKSNPIDVESNNRFVGNYPPGIGMAAPAPAPSILQELVEKLIHRCRAREFTITDPQNLSGEVSYSVRLEIADELEAAIRAAKRQA